MKKMILLFGLFASGTTAFAQLNNDSSRNIFVSYDPNRADFQPLRFSFRPSATATATQNLLNARLSQYTVYELGLSGLNDYIRGNKYALDFYLGETRLTLQRNNARPAVPGSSANEEDITAFKGFADNSQHRIARFCISAADFSGYVWDAADNTMNYYTTVGNFLSSEGVSPDLIPQRERTNVLVFRISDLIGSKATSAPDALKRAIASSGPAWTEGSSSACMPRVLEIAAELDKAYFTPAQRAGIGSGIKGTAREQSSATVNVEPKLIKIWSSAANPRWIGGWCNTAGDTRLAGNFDGQDNDEELFFASGGFKKDWACLENYIGAPGTGDWYQQWSNGGNGMISGWTRSIGDRYYAGDFNGDGKTELLCISSSCATTTVLEFNPGSGWSAKYTNNGQYWVSNWRPYPDDQVLIADYDGDGREEVLYTNNNGWSHVIKFDGASQYTPSTFWTNNGSNYIGSRAVNHIQRKVSGKFSQRSLAEGKYELVLFNDNQMGRYIFNTSPNFNDWEPETSGPGANYVCYNNNNTLDWAILPLSGSERLLAGNFDTDPQHELININNQVARSADVGTNTAAGSGIYFEQRWRNSPDGYFGDLALGPDNDYLLVQACPISSVAGKQLMCTNQYNYTSQLYRGNYNVQNFRSQNPDVKNESATAARIYPNPAHDRVSFEFGKDIASGTVTIADITGRTVGTYQIDHASNTVPLANLPNGMYLINAVFSDKSAFSSKILVQSK